MKIEIICKNWNGLGYDTMLISQGKAEVKYVGYTREEAVKAFKSYLAKFMEIDINKIYKRNFGSGWTQPFRIIKFVRGSNKTKAFIEVYEKSNRAWKPKTKSFVLSEIIADNK